MSLFVIIPTLQRNPFLKQFCLEDMYSCSSDYLWYPHYPGYQGSCYQNVISRDNTGLSPADNIHWLGCIIAVFRRMAFREGGQFTAHKKQAPNSMKTSALGLSPCNPYLWPSGTIHLPLRCPFQHSALHCSIHRFSVRRLRCPFRQPS